MRRRMAWIMGWAAITLIAAAGWTTAGEVREPEGVTKHEYYRARYDVQADGTHIETHAWALTILRKPGLEAAKTASFSYSDRLQDAEILSAYTRKQDGRRIEVPAKNLQIVTRSGQGQAEPMFSDLKTQMVTFPEVEVGDTVLLSYRLTQKEALFPGHFSLIETFPVYSVVDEATLTLTAPDALSLRVFGRGVEGGIEERLEGRRRWHWTYRNARPRRPELGSISRMDYGPVVFASTFPDYPALGAAYDARAKAKARVTPRIRALAETLTREAQSPLDQARVLHEWVSRNIGFAGNCVGVGSVVPHEAETVLVNRLGDCKDHVTLLGALLAAKGIASTPVLVNAGGSYRLPELPVVFAFNHVIIYLPGLDLFLDPSSHEVPFGRVPHDLGTKTVVLAGDPGGVRQLPRSDPKENQAEAKTVVRIQADGTGSGETRFDVRGLFALGLKGWMDYLQPQDEDELIQRLLSGNGFSGSGSLQRPDTSRVAERYRYGVQYELREVMAIPGPAALPIRAPISGAASVARFATGANAPKATVDFTCAGGETVEQFVYHFPNQVTILSVPKDVRFENRLTTYTARYTLEGQVLTVVRAVEDRTPGPVCPLDDALQFRELGEAVLKDIRGQVLYR